MMSTVEDLTRTTVDPETSIFVGNLSPDTTVQDLRNVFGDAVDIEIPSSQTSKRFSKIFAFVKYDDKIDVEELKSKYDKTVIKDKSIYITRALSPEDFASRKQKNGGRRGKAVPAPPTKTKRKQVPLDEMERSTNTLYVNNVPYHTTKAEIAGFFGTTEDSIILPMRRMRDTKTKKVFFSKSSNRGIAFVTYPEGVDIDTKAKEFQGKFFQERELTVDVAANKPGHNEREPEVSTETKSTSE